MLNIRLPAPPLKAVSSNICLVGQLTFCYVTLLSQIVYYVTSAEVEMVFRIYTVPHDIVDNKCNGNPQFSSLKYR